MKYRRVNVRAKPRIDGDAYKELKITERGWPGHFIAARSCLFRRNTLVEFGNDKIVVSTVGDYISPLTNKTETIGYNRWYETMAFIGKEDGGYIDADVSRPVDVSAECGMYASSLEELEQKYGSAWDNAANQMHDNVVAEICERLLDAN